MMTSAHIRDLPISVEARVIVSFFNKRGLLDCFLEGDYEASNECTIAEHKLAVWRAEIRAAMKLEQNTGTGKVYVFQSGGRCKIGYSADPSGRYKTMRGKFSKLRCVFVIKGGRDLEACLHARFKDVACGGEWYILEDFDLSEIRTLCADQVEIDGTDFQQSVRLPLYGMEGVQSQE